MTSYKAGHEHGVTGYGFQKKTAGRKGSKGYAAYNRGYEAGVAGDLIENHRIRRSGRDELQRSLADSLRRGKITGVGARALLRKHGRKGRRRDSKGRFA